jgi:hypothetical protein
MELLKEKIILFIKKQSKLRKTLFAIFVVLTLVIFFLITNTPKKMSENRNSQRRSDILSLSVALYQYTAENNALPEAIDKNIKEICKKDMDCKGMVDLGDLVKKKYIGSIPYDPQKSSAFGTGYMISRSDDGRISIIAPGAELGVKISATR